MALACGGLAFQKCISKAKTIVHPTTTTTTTTTVAATATAAATTGAPPQQTASTGGGTANGDGTSGVAMDPLSTRWWKSAQMNEKAVSVRN